MTEEKQQQKNKKQLSATETVKDKVAKNNKEVQEEKREIFDIKVGMLIRVHQKIKELDAKGKEKERIQIFEGLVIARHGGNEPGATFMVRKIASGGVAVEKIYPLHLPSISKIEILKKHKVKRAKLYYLRGKYKKKLKEIK
ncbi:50S ribosomal protein L19 [Patescibacteria group bacterium]|nr:50S ribosomal protein L19 [Patescibacteria group bacterium]